MCWWDGGMVSSELVESTQLCLNGSVDDDDPDPPDDLAMSDQRGAIKTYGKAGKSATEALILLKVVYGDKALSKSQVFKLHPEFKEGREDIEKVTGKATPRRVRTPENIELVLERREERSPDLDKVGEKDGPVSMQSPFQRKSSWLLSLDMIRERSADKTKDYFEYLD
eukprot:snap_masked-scaffold62_size438377-processed-gene-1.2 protein:Tk07846 transcript:snap_masked-scaffold62_size438377-processed-gene-1.2-mRNA-1 annotation:"PREDICTED: putative uncharacterized protein FLJ37770"